MSIVSLQRVTIVGTLDEKTRVLEELQTLGCVHLEPLANGTSRALAGATPGARRAFRFLASAPGRRHQAHDEGDFDAKAVETRTLAIQDRLRALAEERRFLQRRIRDLAPWGDFRLPQPDERLGLRLWFYVVPHYLLERMPRDGAAWQAVHRDNRFAYVAVLAADEPHGMPVERTHTGSVPLAELEQRLEAVEVEEDDLQAERVALSRWLDLFAANIARLEDDAARAAAAGQTRDDDALFMLQGWAPSACVPRLREAAERRCCALIAAPPDAQADPPTLLANHAIAASGQDLLSIYVTPGYRTWDPSPVLVASFAIFFGMILADAGYALVLAAVTAAFWRKLGRTEGRQRLRNLLHVLAAAAAGAGVLTGSYFGEPPPAGSVLGRLQRLDATNTVAMMEVAAGLGVLHVALANLVAGSRRRGAARLAPLGWAVVVIAGAALYAGESRAVDALRWAGYAGLALGGIAVVGFTGAGHRPLARATEGLLAITRVSAAFGDVLSYLRLFALGFAGTSLALAFNGLAAKVAGEVPGLGLLAAGLILLLGHGLNFVLGVAGGFVHGLRLNFIEFFNWSLDAEGRPFQAFRKREVTPSTR